MNYQLRYSGLAVSREGVSWRVDIRQQRATSYPSVGELAFPGNEPLIVEWMDSAKEDVIQSSVATLKLISPSDRAYEDLYTTEVGEILLEVYRNEELWWHGTMDTEFYEEPYASMEGYVVTLTFGDFGVLKRKKAVYGGTLASMLNSMLADCGLYTNLVSTSYVGTRYNGVNVMSALAVMEENWADEEGELCTMEEAITGMLQPLGLKMVQRAGVIWVYDLHTLYQSGAGQQIRWMSDNHTMGVDRVVNRVNVTFSPYAKAKQTVDLAYADAIQKSVEQYVVESLEGPVTGDLEDYTVATVGIGAFVLNYRGGRSFTYMLEDNLSVPGFTMHLSNSGYGVRDLNAGVGCFKIEPIYSGSEEEGIVAEAPFMQVLSNGQAMQGSLYPVVVEDTSKVLFKFPATALSSLSESEARRYRLRIDMDMLLSMCYNPYEEYVHRSAGGNIDGALSKVVTEQLIANTRACYVPVNIYVLDEYGNRIYFFNNLQHIKNTKSPAAYVDLATSCGGWWPIAFEAQMEEHPCYLAYYDASDKATTMMGKWTSTRQAAGFAPTVDRTEAYKRIDSGQYLDYPPYNVWYGKPSYLEIEVLQGCRVYPIGKSWNCDTWENHVFKSSSIDSIHFPPWLMYKNTAVTVVRNGAKMVDEESDDVQYYGYLDEHAAEDMDIGTMCGTMDEPCLTARGIYRDAGTGGQVTTVTRAGSTDAVERLLIGTLTSNYGGRRTKLTGTIEALTGGLRWYTEYMQGATKRFLLTREVADLCDDLSDVSLVEFVAD